MKYKTCPKCRKLFKGRGIWCNACNYEDLKKYGKIQKEKEQEEKEIKKEPLLRVAEYPHFRLSTK